MAEETLALDAADGTTLRELAKVGKVLVAAEHVIRLAKNFKTQIDGWETQAGRLKDVLIADGLALERLREEIRDAQETHRVATESATGAEAARDRRLATVLEQENTATSQLRMTAEQHREGIRRDTDALRFDLETQKQGIKAELDEARARLEQELRLLQADIQNAKDEVQRAQDEHAQFIRSVSHPLDPKGH